VSCSICTDFERGTCQYQRQAAFGRSGGQGEAPINNGTLLSVHLLPAPRRPLRFGTRERTWTVTDTAISSSRIRPIPPSKVYSCRIGNQNITLKLTPRRSMQLGSRVYEDAGIACCVDEPCASIQDSLPIGSPYRAQAGTAYVEGLGSTKARRTTKHYRPYHACRHITERHTPNTRGGTVNKRNAHRYVLAYQDAFQRTCHRSMKRVATSVKT